MILRRAISPLAIMALAVYLAALALGGKFPRAGGRAGHLSDLVAWLVEQLGPNGAAFLILLAGAGLAGAALALTKRLGVA